MTGFGRGMSQTPSKRIKVEIKSLNSKQLDLSMRVPAGYKEMEVALRKPVADRLERGKVELTASVESVTADASASVNVEILKGYKSQIDNLGVCLGLPEPNDWYGLLLRMPDALRTDNQEEMDEEEAAAFSAACMEAVEALVDFRRKEGHRLYGFFVEKISRIRALLGEVEVYEAERVPKIRERLEDQLTRLTSIEYDRGRLEQEMIFYIEKLDVSEEKLRLSTHLNYFLETLGPEDVIPDAGQGKKLGFIAQEMGREINTLGSKANHAEMQKIVVMMKDELEQIKEQVLNVL